MDIDPYVTHTFKGLENVNKSIDALHSGDCLRAIVHISDFELAGDPMTFEQVSNNKVQGGYLK